MSVVLMSKRELNRIDVLARLESGRLTPGAATARPQPDRRHREGRPGGSTVERRQRAARPDVQDGGADAPAPADHWGECGGALGRPEGTAGWVLARADDEPQAAPAGPGGAGQQDGPHRPGPSRQGRGLSSSGRGGGIVVGTAARLSRGRKVRGKGMALRSARRDRENQCATPYREYAALIWTRSANLYGAFSVNRFFSGFLSPPGSV